MPSPLLHTAPHLSDEWRRQYIDQLIRWFDKHQRDLPWRLTRDAYAIWISESMLQQTQVATVIAYYQRFMARFPDVQSLAAADEQEVLTYWAGLGYYRRARQLHLAACRIASEHAGVFPAALSDLLALPGIGRYTAGAIASIAHGQAAPIVEANTQRLYARLMCLDEELTTPTSQQLLWSFAQWQLVEAQPVAAKTSNEKTHDVKIERGPLKTTTRRKRSVDKGSYNRPGTINQAAMELGSLICKPTSPHCLICPLASICETAKRGWQDRIPRAKAAKKFSSLHHVALIIRSGSNRRSKWLVRINPEGAWWTGLWDFPRVDVTELSLRPPPSTLTTKRQPAPSLSQDGRTRIEHATAQQLGLVATLEADQPRWTLCHGVTRYRITVDCFDATTEYACDQVADNQGWKWVEHKQLTELPLTASAKKIAAKLID